MKYLLFVAFIIIITFSKLSAQSLNAVKIDEKSNKEVLYGQCSKSGLQNSPLFAEYFKTEYSLYKPIDSVMLKLKQNKNLKKLQFTIVFGSWCGDSQEQLPRLFYIFDQLKIDEKKINIYAVDRTKKSGITEIDNYKVELVPTIYVRYKNNEVGKIIETPKETLETDLLKIVESFCKCHYKK